MASSPWLRRSFTLAGVVLLGASVVFLARAFDELELSALLARLGAAGWVFVAACSVAYGAMLLLLAAGWRKLADPAATLSPRQILEIYGPAVVAKYVPGSVLQYASRQVLGSRFGLQHKAMAQSSFVEAAIHPGAALMAASAIAVFGAGGALLGILLGVALWLWTRSPVLAAAGIQLTFFTLFGAVAVLLAWGIGGASQPGLLAGCFLVAWVAGFVVPVAPGGIGIREAALVALAAGVETADTLALVAVATRLVTLAGDAGLGAVAYLSLAARRENRQALR